MNTRKPSKTVLDTSGFVDISGYEGLYAVNKHGDIYSYPKTRPDGSTLPEKIMGKYLTRNGYINTCLSRNGDDWFGTVHRVVANTFLSEVEGKPCVNHKDGNKLNNNVENLEWCNWSENHKHAYSIGLHKPRRKNEICRQSY